MKLDYKKTLRTFGFVLIASAISACGGGGGGSTTGSTGGSGSTGGNTGGSSGSTSQPVQQNLQVAVVPTYAADSEELNYFNTVNTFRTSQGLGPLKQNAAYDAASKAHALYIDQNDPNDQLSHSETAGNPGFTGTNPYNRVIAQGGTATLVTEEAGYPNVQGVPGAGTDFANVLIDTVYHRASLLFQGATEIGVWIGMTPPPAAPASSVSDLGYLQQQVNSGTYFNCYPINGQTGVALHMQAESPSPFPASVNVATQTGYPISCASQQTTTFTVSSFTITQQGTSSPLSATQILGTQDPNLLGNNNLAYLVANAPLLPNTTYTVSVSGLVTGTATGSSTGIPVSQTFSFTTGSTNP